MALDMQSLDALARDYTAGMTSIRGRRVRRLILREFSRFDIVVQAVGEDRAPVVFAMSEDGGAALCRTDGRGAAADVETWTDPGSSKTTLSFDLAKDSLPEVRRITCPGSLADRARTLSLPVGEPGDPNSARIAAWLRRTSAGQNRLGGLGARRRPRD